MYHLRRATITAVVLVALVFVIWLLPKVLNPTPPSPEDHERDRRWVDSSPYWLDRQACRWVSLCGVHHIKWDAPELPRKNETGGGDQGARDLGRWQELRRRSFVGGEEDETRRWETASPPRTHGRPRRGIGKRDNGTRVLKEIPDYVLKYAPFIHLYSDEHFLPSDIAEHVKHMTPFVDGAALNTSATFDLTNLYKLDSVEGKVYLTSKDDVETRPEWLHSHANVPDAVTDDDDSRRHDASAEDSTEVSGGTTWWDADPERPPNHISEPRRLSVHQRGEQLGHAGTSPRRSHENTENTQDKPNAGGYSRAPATLVLIDKGNGILDAFWFFFYSYNLGQTVFSIRFGNHIGDWEHCMVRFEHGEPRAMFLSEHEGGKTYAWSALEKRSVHNNTDDAAARPVIYSAVGSHAMYAMPGNQPYVLPFGLLKDQTDRGALWDPSLNTYAYWYDYDAARGDPSDEKAEEDESDEPAGLVPAAQTPDAPTSWFHFSGQWGDELYPLADGRQWRLFGQYHYITGPRGPKFKNLARRKMCPRERCRILDSLEAGRKASWYS